MALAGGGGQTVSNEGGDGTDNRERERERERGIKGVKGMGISKSVKLQILTLSIRPSGTRKLLIRRQPVF